VIGDVFTTHPNLNLLLLIFARERAFVSNMLVVRSSPIPGVVGIAPITLKIAAAGTYKNTGHAGRYPFTLKAIENLGSFPEFS
jgi:hypothetical protein